MTTSSQAPVHISVALVEAIEALARPTPVLAPVYVCACGERCTGAMRVRGEPVCFDCSLAQPNDDWEPTW